MEVERDTVGGLYRKGDAAVFLVTLLCVPPGGNSTLPAPKTKGGLAYAVRPEKNGIRSSGTADAASQAWRGTLRALHR
jgi:hypothetical protein